MTGSDQLGKFHWQQLLTLGEQLVRLPSIAAQRLLIEQATIQFVNGTARVWLVGPAYPLPGTSPTEYLQEPLSSLAQIAIETGKFACDYAPSRKRVKPISTVAFPLVTPDLVLGILEVQSPKEAPFDQDQVNFLKTLADYIALGMEVNRQVALSNWRFEQLALVRSVSFQMANVLEINELARRITSLILQTFRYYYVAIYTIETGLDVMECRACAKAGQAPRVDLEHKFQVKIGEGIVGHVALTSSEIIANDVSAEPLYRVVEPLADTKAEIALPLKIENRLLGVLDIRSDQVEVFSDIDLMVMHALADNIALAIENAHLHQASQNKAQQITTVAEIGQAITKILDLDELLSEIVNLIHTRFNYPFVHLFSVHLGRRLILFRAGAGARSQLMNANQMVYEIDDPAGIIPYSVRQKQTVLSQDISQDKNFLPSPTISILTGSELTIPLIFNEEVLGVLDIQSEKVNAFKEADLTLLYTLADSITIAFRNAKLYESEKWRRQVAESLRDVAWMLTENAALESLLDAILTSLEKNLPCDIAGIWLFDEAKKKPSETPALKLVAVHGVDKNTIDQVRQLTPESDEWLNEALNAEHPLVRKASDRPGLLGQALDFPETYSAVAAPVKTGELKVGLLALAHHTAERYGDESRSMTSTFASYAGIAIANTRLYEEAQEQAWVSTVLLQVAQATQSLTTVDDLLATIVRLTPLLVGINGCAFFVWDTNRNAFIMNSAYGLPNDLQEDFAVNPRFPLLFPAFDSLLQTREPVIIQDPASELKITLNDELVDTSFTLFPMIARSGTQGAFLILRGAQSQAMGDGDELAIIQGITHQTATAVENIRLLEARQEEAYVTAVLLQVAQSVVNLSELSDILDSIVHIIPILVGIDCAVIYLWDYESSFLKPQYVHCGEAHFEDDLLSRSFRSGEFPVLDYVWEHDAPAVYLLDESISSPDRWPAIGSDQSPSSIQDGAPLKGGLLMGCPLSVKGERYGVMLAFDNTETVYRERRFEIITGIAQQAALAIQNDYLRKDVLEREGLEREFQLAREIQQTFLPSKLPELDMWNIAVRWHTARQVGGDFYDFIELPGNRVGLVIADVSDKGMPAALYMTVTRTLMRASVPEFVSPAEVLEHVNDMLLMNSENGLFVTIFYAVLSLETGRLVYANAGHNIPLFLRANDRPLEFLAKGGTALGFLDNLRLEDHTTTINPGDSILLYTDGVTEAFSPEGEIYGDERLSDCLRNLVNLSAEEMLNRLDESLSDFRKNLPYSDDTTMVAIRRLV